MTLSLDMRNACFKINKFFFDDMSLQLIDEELYTSCMFIEDIFCVFIEFCENFSFCRRNYKMMIFTFLKCHVLCQLLSSMRLLT